MPVSFAHGVLVLLMLCCLTLFHSSIAYTLEDLVKNGGFETGDFAHWTGAEIKVVPNADGSPAHSGEYSARIGSESSDGQVSQVISIPSKCTGKFTAWYRLEERTRLIILLKSNEGSVIQQWSMTDGESWTPVTYNLDPSYVGGSISIEFVGYRKALQRCNAWHCPAIDYFYPYVDDVSLTCLNVNYRADVSVEGLPQELSTKVLVDGSRTATIAGGESASLTFNLGESHKISVETYVYRDDKTRYYCANDSQTVNSEGSVSFHYATQYYVSVNSPHGDPTGSRWYDEGDIAGFSVNKSVSGPNGTDYFLIHWKVTYIFDHWTGDSSATSQSGSVKMDGPKTVTATWRSEKSSDYTLLLAVIGVIAGGTALTYLAVSRRKRPPKASDYLLKLDGLKAQGIVSEEIYWKLRREYEERRSGLRNK